MQNTDENTNDKDIRLNLDTPENTSGEVIIDENTASVEEKREDIKVDSELTGEKCPECDGGGLERGTGQLCSNCKGKGTI